MDRILIRAVWPAVRSTARAGSVYIKWGADAAAAAAAVWGNLIRPAMLHTSCHWYCCEKSWVARTKSSSVEVVGMNVGKVRSIGTSGSLLDKRTGSIKAVVEKRKEKAKTSQKNGDEVRRKNLRKNLNLLQEWGVSQQGLFLLKQYRKTAELNSRVVAEKLRWFVGWFGFTQKQAVKVVQGYPHVLGLALDDSVRQFMELFLESGVARKEIGSMVLSQPKMLGRAKKFQYLQELLGKELGLEEKEFAVMVAKFPQILLKHPVQSMVERMVQSFSNAGIDSHQLCLMCKKFPQLLLLSLEEDIQPTVDKFQELGLSKNDLGTVLTGAPSLLCKDFDKLVLGKLKFLHEEMQFSKSHALQLLVKDPRKFRDDLRTWRETYLWLLSKGMGIKNAQKFAEKNMCIMSRSCKALEEKYKFAVDVLGKTNEEILTCPRYFNASFEHVIMFRAALLHSQGIDCTTRALGHIVASSSIFERRYGRNNCIEFQKHWSGFCRDKKVLLSWGQHIGRTCTST